MRLWTGFAAAIVAVCACGTAEAGDKPRRLDLKIPNGVDYETEAARLRRGEPENRAERRFREEQRFRADRIRLADSPEDRLRAVGVRDGDQFGQRNRLYFFAGSEDGAVGYNITRGEGGWSREGFSMDNGAFMGDAQAGVAWRRGDVQASFGYVRREIEGRGRLNRGFDDDVVALQFSYTPGR